MMNEAGSGDNGDPVFEADIAAQIQTLTDEIADLNAAARATADATVARRVYLKQRTIGRLRLFLPSIPTSSPASRSSSHDTRRMWTAGNREEATRRSG